MTARPTTSWQTILADLAMILFMVTASALSDPVPVPKAVPKALPLPPASVLASPRAEPVGVWRDEPGAPGLEQWLAQQGRDPRLRATVLVREGGNADAALDHARRLVAALGFRSHGARVVVEPGTRDGGAIVTLGYDVEALAR